MKTQAMRALEVAAQLCSTLTALTRLEMACNLDDQETPAGLGARPAAALAPLTALKRLDIWDNELLAALSQL
jgi:hypothetical protein